MKIRLNKKDKGTNNMCSNIPRSFLIRRECVPCKELLSRRNVISTHLSYEILSLLVDDVPILFVWTSSHLMLDWRLAAVSFIGTRDPLGSSSWISPTRGGILRLSCEILWIPQSRPLSSSSAPVSLSRPAAMSLVTPPDWRLLICKSFLVGSLSDSLLKMKSIIHRSHVDYVILN